MVLLLVIGYGSCMGFVTVKMMLGKVIFGVGLGRGWKMVLVSFITLDGGNRCIAIFRI